MAKQVSKETVEEFLARGGSITKVEAVPPKKEKHFVFYPTPSVNDAMSLGDAQLYFAQKSERKNKGTPSEKEEG
jgi:hypothetical protein